MTDLKKKAQISNYMQTRPVGADLFHADRQTKKDKHDKAISLSLRNFGDAPITKKENH